MRSSSRPAGPWSARRAPRTARPSGRPTGRRPAPGPGRPACASRPRAWPGTRPRSPARPTDGQKLAGALLVIRAGTPRSSSATATFSNAVGPGKQGVVLEHESDARRHAVDRLAVQLDRADSGCEQPRDQLEDRALAAAARPDQRDELAVLDLHRDPLQGTHRTAPAREPDSQGTRSRDESEPRLTTPPDRCTTGLVFPLMTNSTLYESNIPQRGVGGCSARLWIARLAPWGSCSHATRTPGRPDWTPSVSNPDSARVSPSSLTLAVRAGVAIHPGTLWACRRPARSTLTACRQAGPERATA